MKDTKHNVIERDMSNYKLLMSYKPCDIFRYFKVQDMHGLSFLKCIVHKNNNQQAYVAGLTNYIPKKDNKYEHGDPFFVFINLSRCTDDMSTCVLVNHELLHRAFELYNWDINKEEEIISWASDETPLVTEIVLNIINNKKEKEEEDYD